MLNGVLWAFLRRWYGGLYKDDKYPILSNRGLQTAVMILFMTLIFIFGFQNERKWLLAFSLAIWVQFQFWSRAVGEILDCGRSTTQDAESYDRWYRIPLDWVYDRLRKAKYMGYYDWWYMWLRYTLPMIVPALALADWRFIVIGLLSSPVYFGCYRLFELYPRLYKLPACIGQPKNLSEVVFGFVFGLIVGA